MSVLGEYTNDAESILAGTDLTALQDLRLNLIGRKKAAEAMKGERKARAEMLVTIDGWLNLVNHRIKVLKQNFQVEQAEAAIRELRRRFRDLIPHLTYSGPDPIAWGRFCADINPPTGSVRKRTPE